MYTSRVNHEGRAGKGTMEDPRAYAQVEGEGQIQGPIQHLLAKPLQGEPGSNKFGIRMLRGDYG